MVLLESTRIPLGTKMPDFQLPNSHGEIYKSDELYGKNGLLFIITCNHCPYAVAVWGRLIRLAQFAKKKGIHTVAINPNIHPNYPEDRPEVMKQKILEWGIFFPYLVDESQEVAKEYDAQCTPDIYLMDANHSLVYHGRIDDNWQDEKKVTREELKEAVSLLAEGKEISNQQNPSIGCSIKWK